MNLITITTYLVDSGILGDIISGLVIALVIFSLSVMRERKQLHNQNKAFFIENAVDNAYFLDLSTLGDKSSYRYLDKIKEYKKLITLLALLFDCSIEDVNYFDFTHCDKKVNEGANGEVVERFWYVYTMNVEKYNFVIDELNKRGLL